MAWYRLTQQEEAHAWRPDFADFLLSSHLAHARRMLPVIAALADDVSACRASGAPPLDELRQTIDELSVALLPTEDKDVALLDEEGFDGTAVAQALGAAARDRYCVSCLVIRLREAVQRLPSSGRPCATYRTLFRELKRLTSDASLLLPAMAQSDKCAA